MPCIKATCPRSVGAPSTRRLLQCGRRNAAIHAVSRTHPYIPDHLYPSIFPLYNPASVDMVIFWDMPSEQRSGHIYMAGITLGAGHAALQEVIEAVEGARVKRSIYAETQREKAEILDGVKESEWNAEMNPLVLSLGTGTLLHDFAAGFVQVRPSVEAMADILLQALSHSDSLNTPQLFCNP
jgi:trafficking protein particle complex subunit 8